MLGCRALALSVAVKSGVNGGGECYRGQSPHQETRKQARLWDAGRARGLRASGSSVPAPWTMRSGHWLKPGGRATAQLLLVDVQIYSAGDSAPSRALAAEIAILILEAVSGFQF